MSISEDLKAYLELHRRLLMSEVAQIDRMLGREVRRESAHRIEAEIHLNGVYQAPPDMAEVLRRG